MPCALTEHRFLPLNFQLLKGKNLPSLWNCVGGQIKDEYEGNEDYYLKSSFGLFCNTENPNKLLKPTGRIKDSSRSAVVPLYSHLTSLDFKAVTFIVLGIFQEFEMYLFLGYSVLS